MDSTESIAAVPASTPSGEMNPDLAQVSGEMVVQDKYRTHICSTQRRQGLAACRWDNDPDPDKRQHRCDNKQGARAARNHVGIARTPARLSLMPK